jgi:hypothetical protein
MAVQKPHGLGANDSSFRFVRRQQSGYGLSPPGRSAGISRARLGGTNLEYARHASPRCLRLFPVEGVDILGSRVAEQQR